MPETLDSSSESLTTLIAGLYRYLTLIAQEGPIICRIVLQTNDQDKKTGAFE